MSIARSLLTAVLRRSSSSQAGPSSFTAPNNLKVTASWFGTRQSSTATMGSQKAKWKVAIIGSGNWGTAIARIVGQNAAAKSDLFDTEVNMWCYEEQFEGRKLTELFNEKHENVKYLPGIKISDNVKAVPDIVDAVKGANALVVVIPHQFIRSVCEQLKGKIPAGSKAISLIKGVDVHENSIDIFAHVLEKDLGVSCSSLSGANIANEVARDAFSETTIGYATLEEGQRWKELFQTQHFRVQLIDDVVGVSIAGALKNVVAVASGFVDGLGWGNNAKAAIMRLGLLEMRSFCLEFFEGTRGETFVHESAGVADLITSCLGGRNRQVAEAFIKTGKPFDVLEKELLNGQKLQGVQTAKEINTFLKAKNRVDAYPLFRVVYRIAFEGLDAKKMTSHI